MGDPIRLDIWHFMRVMTDSHILYPIFMWQLSYAIFEWLEDDVELLKRVKRGELEVTGLQPTEEICVWFPKQ